MTRKWIPTVTPRGACVLVQARQWPPLEREPEPEAIGRAQRAFVRPPGRLARVFRDTLEKRVRRTVRRIGRWCDGENVFRAQVAAATERVVDRLFAHDPVME